MMDDDDGHTKFQFAHKVTQKQTTTQYLTYILKSRYIITTINLILTDKEKKKQYLQMWLIVM